MREIKFRALCNTGDKIEMIVFENGEFDNGYWFNCPAHVAHIDEYLSPLMQYTGIKDKNGKEIYESDIVKSFCFQIDENFMPTKDVLSQHTSTVYWDEEQAGWGLKSDEFEQLFEPLSHFDEHEVVGNLHENPELLK